MDGDWEEVCRIQLPPSGVLSDHFQAPVRAFDTSQELFWTGDELGRVKSFYGLDGHRYTSYKAGQDPIRQFLFHDKGVISVGGRSVHMASRRGLYIWHITHEDMKDLRCMSYTSRGTSEILVAGLQDQMFVIDVDKGIITKQVPSSDHFKIMKRSRYICAATPSGSVHILDCINFNVVKVWQAHTALINDMDAQSKIRFAADYNNPVEFADSDENLFSSEYNWYAILSRKSFVCWPSHMIFEVGAPPVKVESSYISSPKVFDADKAPASIQAPKFLSEKAREAVNDATSERGTIALYMNVEIKYSKFGVDDFDFGFYNKTPYSGLETHISNSYANALLQFDEIYNPYQKFALQHTATSCVNDVCLLCEMGFLFDMLEKAAGTVCQATNLLKTFGHYPEAKNLGLLEENSHGGVSLTTMLQTMNRFFLDRIPNEYKAFLLVQIFLSVSKQSVDNAWKQNLDTSLLYADENKRVIDKTHRPLSPDGEKPTEGTIIALDTEFVSIRQPEIEDTIVDYLTSYSGISPGDLDPRQSRHNLVSLKIAYKKLWILLNLGCKFVGHGLKTDFRVINIQIPKTHVIDTADLFFIPAKQRKLGLAFLAWYLFREDIQVETHDSIEDARTALRLWKKWEEWVAAEENGGAPVEDLLMEVYRVGQASSFRPPGFNARKEREREREREGKDISRTNTPPGVVKTEVRVLGT
ncbi:hypothetical protein DID88_004433 [Monilinia fructigena]|uniref:Exonuclease domain-containing protein n=1 Tax=Monilinia fructigena TaxID=38457 RepID=A0A395IQJ4_9HELO|nr:hypothetical protein DID88_004433 [Monilinia fructigena]